MSEDRPYSVGRGKPPVETRWPKGRSGNPKGRPKGAKNHQNTGIHLYSKKLDDLLFDEFNREIRVTERGKTVRMSVFQAAARKFSMSALNGNRLALIDMFRIARLIETERNEQSHSDLNQLLTYQAEGLKALEDARRSGRPEPALLPHPEDIVFDPETSGYKIDGPLIPEAKQGIDAIVAMAVKQQGAVSFAAKLFAEARGAKKKAALSAWHHAQDYYDRLNDPLPVRYRKSLVDRSFAEGATVEGQFAGGWEPPSWLPKQE